MFSCLDMSVVSTALVAISIDLDNDYLNAPWVILAYLLTYMGECLPRVINTRCASDRLCSICGGILEAERHLRTPQHADCRMGLLCRVLCDVYASKEHDATVSNQQIPRFVNHHLTLFSPSIVGRALQGIGGAGLYSLAQICLIELGLGRPETVGAMVGITLSISYVLGPLLGGVISSRWNWTGIFMIK